MTYEVKFTEPCKSKAAKWLKAHHVYHKKFRDLLEELSLHPRTGTGKPEALRGGGGMVWSRRLTKKDRIIYEIHDNLVRVLVVGVGDHYDDL